MVAQPCGFINATHCTLNNGLHAKFCYACYYNLKKNLSSWRGKKTQKHTRDNLSRESRENAGCKAWLALFAVPKLISNLQTLGIHSRKYAGS